MFAAPMPLVVPMNLYPAAPKPLAMALTVSSVTAATWSLLTG